MDDRELRAIADAWWGATGETNAFSAPHELVWEHSPDVSKVIALMVRSPRALKVPLVGTAIVENLYDDDVHTALDITLAANLTPDELFAVLSGVYPELLVAIGVRERLAGTFDASQIEWLTTYNAPDRHDSM